MMDRIVNRSALEFELGHLAAAIFAETHSMRMDEAITIAQRQLPELLAFAEQWDLTAQPDPTAPAPIVARVTLNPVARAA